ncbi:unnamed protein product [Chironomus riparius]|uniref:Uncharacterized protein n=1 Tax=Chironomus riparius TaxID=315576 RepID=A0A9N9WN24_9DIPT|nr:unnamed protein product [Chironomus riparius]
MKVKNEVTSDCKKAKICVTPSKSMVNNQQGSKYRLCERKAKSKSPLNNSLQGRRNILKKQLRQSSSRKHWQLFNGFDDDIASYDGFQNQSDNENITKQAINEKAYTISSSSTEKRCSNAQRQSQAINPIPTLYYKIEVDVKVPVVM